MSDVFLKSKLTQTAVYWGTPVKDGYGGFTYAAPIEIKCRWEDKAEIFKSLDGVEKVSNAIVYVDRDLSTEGFMMLGDLDDLDSSQEMPDDKVTYEILKIEKSRALNKKGKYIRKVVL